jgi:pimeloyl-ACP methyl ester carboxylesterase
VEPCHQTMRTRGPQRVSPHRGGTRSGVCKQVSRAESTQSIVEFIVGHGLTNIVPVVPVGHSYGGTTISKVAELIPDRVRRLVFYSGFCAQRW